MPTTADGSPSVLPTLAKDSLGSFSSAPFHVLSTLQIQQFADIGYGQAKATAWKQLRGETSWVFPVFMQSIEPMIVVDT